MTKKINRTVFLSAVFLIAAVLMLIGAVYAWFAISTRPAAEGFELKVFGKDAANVGVTVDGEVQSPNIRFEGVIPGRVFRISLSVVEGADRALYFAILNPKGDVLNADGTKIADFLDVFCITVRAEYLLSAFQKRFGADEAALGAFAAGLKWYDAANNELSGVLPVMQDGVLTGFRAGTTDAEIVKYSLNSFRWAGFGPEETSDKVCVPVVWGFTVGAGVRVDFDLEFADAAFDGSDTDINVFQNKVFALREFYIDTKAGGAV